MNYSNTNTVQSFIRGLAWFLTLALLMLFFGVPAASLSQAATGTSSTFLIPVFVFSVWVASIVSKMFFILPEWERIVILRLGKFDGVKGPGYFVIPPFVYSVAAIVDTRIETHQVEATATLTKDNVPTKVTAAVEFKLEDPRKAIVDVQNYRQSVIWLSTEALKNTIGSLDLKDLLSERDQIAKSLQTQIDEGAAVYGIDVRAVRITDIDTPASLIEELAVIARARRGAEAKQIQANAEILVAEKIAQAGSILANSPAGIKLRELQLLAEISKEQGSTIVVYPYQDANGREIAHSAINRIKS